MAINRVLSLLLTTPRFLLRTREPWCLRVLALAGRLGFKSALVNPFSAPTLITSATPAPPRQVDTRQLRAIDRLAFELWYPACGIGIVGPGRCVKCGGR